jgi:hypothetical protein
MRVRRILLLALVGSILVLAVASCGRYGKPVRSGTPAGPAPEPAEHALSAQKR